MMVNVCELLRHPFLIFLLFLFFIRFGDLLETPPPSYFLCFLFLRKFFFFFIFVLFFLLTSYVYYLSSVLNHSSNSSWFNYFISILSFFSSFSFSYDPSTFPEFISYLLQNICRNDYQGTTSHTIFTNNIIIIQYINPVINYSHIYTNS